MSTVPGVKRYWPVITILAGLSIALLILRQCRQDGDVSYQAAPVTRGPITQLVTATGTLNPVVNVQVGSQVSGNIQKLFADFNSKVKAGDIVAQIDPVVFKAARWSRKVCRKWVIRTSNRWPAASRPGERPACPRIKGYGLVISTV